MRVVVALGGNALQKRGEPMTVENQRANVKTACRALSPVAMEHELVISHGNGPQVGLLSLQASSYDEEPTPPFAVLGAQTEGIARRPWWFRRLTIEDRVIDMDFDGDTATVSYRVQVGGVLRIDADHDGSYGRKAISSSAIRYARFVRREASAEAVVGWRRWRMAALSAAVVALAVLLAVLGPVLFAGTWGEWLYQALVLLVIACPCALVVSTPITVVSGLAAAARHGILIKGGAHLEGGRLLKAVALDKTGTLTQGKHALTDAAPFGDLPLAEALLVAASLDEHSTHPVAQAPAPG